MQALRTFYSISLTIAVAAVCVSSADIARAQETYGELGMAESPAPLRSANHHDFHTPWTGTRPLQLDIHGGFSWYGYGLATGARFGIPLVENGFIGSLDNSFYLNFGLDFYFIDDPGCYRRGNGTYDCSDYRFAMGIPVAAHWEFYFNDTWSAFAELGAQIYLPTSLFYNGTVYYRYAGAWVIGGVGGSLHFDDTWVLTLRIGNPYIALGLTINF